MLSAMTATRGYTATKDQLLARLKRIEGQIRGIEGMVQEDRYCIDVLTQISAARAALDKVALGLLDDHAHHCVVGADTAEERDEKTAELMEAVGRLMRRGRSCRRYGAAARPAATARARRPDARTTRRASPPGRG